MEDINIPLLQGNLEDIIQEQSVNNTEEQGRDSTANTQEIYDQEARLISLIFGANNYFEYLIKLIFVYLYIELRSIILHYPTTSKI